MIHLSGSHSTSVRTRSHVLDAPEYVDRSISVPCGVWHTTHSLIMKGLCTEAR